MKGFFLCMLTNGSLAGPNIRKLTFTSRKRKKEICSISSRSRVLAHRPCPKLEMFCPSVLQLFFTAAAKFWWPITAWVFLFLIIVISKKVRAKICIFTVLICVSFHVGLALWFLPHQWASDLFDCIRAGRSKPVYSLVQWNWFSVVTGCTWVACISDMRKPISLHQAVHQCMMS